MTANAVNHSRMRRMNCVAVLRQLHLAGPLSRIELAQRLQLDSKTLTNLVRELTERNFVAETDIVMDGGRGRPRQRLRLIGENINALGVHVTEKSVRCGIINLNGEIRGLRMLEIGKEDTAEELIGKIRRVIRMTIDADPGRILGVGIAHPGMCDTQSGRVIRCVNLPHLENVQLSEVVMKIAPQQISLKGDTQARALAEYWFGAARNLEDYIYIDLGVGIGCAFVKNGKAEEGMRGIAGELGHTIIVPGGKKCSCGRKGCLETVASLDRIQSFSGHEFHEKLEAPAAAVGLSIANLICLLNPRDIILGGDSLHLGSRFVELIEQAIYSSIMKEFMQTFSLRQSRLGDNGALLGSVVGILDSIFQG